MRSIDKLVLILVLVIAPAISHAERYAVLIGVEDYPNLPRPAGLSVALPGPANDVSRLRTLLVDRYGIDSVNVRVLLNEQATHDIIKSTIGEWLLGKVKNGDTSLIFFSGHGTGLPDRNGDESDGRDEALVCNDFSPVRPSIGQYVLDDELARWFAQAVDKGAKVVFIADCCHSGTISRDVLSTSLSKYTAPPEALVREMGGWHFKARAFTKEASQDDGAGVTLIAACLDDQTSATAMFPAVSWMGALTYSLVGFLETSARNPTYGELGAYLQRSVDVKFQQTPQVSTPDLSEPFMAVSHVAAAAATVSTTVNTTVTTTVTTTPITPATAADSDRLLICLQGFGEAEPSVADVLGSTGYVTAVGNQADADRVIVRKSEDRFDANLDLRDGSIEDTVSAQTADEMVHRLRPSLMRAYVWKRLAALQSEDESFRPEVWIDGSYRKNLSVRPTALQPASTVVKIGEKTVFRFRAAKACYVTLIDLPTEGRLTVLFPNTFNPQSQRVQPNMPYAIPSAEMNFDILAEGPSGRDIVIAIASEKPLDLSALKLSVVDQVTGIARSTDDDAGTRLFRVTGRNDQAVISSGGRFAVAYTVAEVVD